MPPQLAYHSLLARDSRILVYTGAVSSHDASPKTPRNSDTSLRRDEDIAPRRGRDQNLDNSSARGLYESSEAELHGTATWVHEDDRQTTGGLYSPRGSYASTMDDIHQTGEPVKNEWIGTSNNILEPSSPKYIASSPFSRPASHSEPSTAPELHGTGELGGRLTTFVIRSQKLMRLRIKAAERRRRSLNYRKTLKRRLRQLRYAKSGECIDEDDGLEEPLNVLWDRVDAADERLAQDDEQLAIEEAKILRLGPKIFTEGARSRLAPIPRDQLDLKGEDHLSERELAMDDDADLDADVQEILWTYREESRIEDEILRLTHQQDQLMTEAFNRSESEHATASPVDFLDELDEKRENLNKRLSMVLTKREQLLDRVETAPPLYELPFTPTMASEQPLGRTSVRSLPSMSRPESATIIPSSASVGNDLNSLSHSASYPRP